MIRQLPRGYSLKLNSIPKSCGVFFCTVQSQSVQFLSTMFCPVRYYVGGRNLDKSSYSYLFTSSVTLGKVLNFSGETPEWEHCSILPSNTLDSTTELPIVCYGRKSNGLDSSPNSATHLLCYCGQFILPCMSSPKMIPQKR